MIEELISQVQFMLEDAQASVLRLVQETGEAGFQEVGANIAAALETLALLTPEPD